MPQWAVRSELFVRAMIEERQVACVFDGGRWLSVIILGHTDGEEVR